MNAQTKNGKRMVLLCLQLLLSIYIQQKTTSRSVHLPEHKEGRGIVWLTAVTWSSEEQNRWLKFLTL